MTRAEEMKRHAAVEEVTSSLSWRLTKPLRALNRLPPSRARPGTAQATAATTRGSSGGGSGAGGLGSCHRDRRI